MDLIVFQQIRKLFLKVVEALDVAQGRQELLLRRRVLGRAAGQHGQSRLQAERGNDQIVGSVFRNLGIIIVTHLLSNKSSRELNDAWSFESILYH